MIAHAGFAGVAPENTLAAFRAIADGTHPAAMVEIDVMPCADGTPVVFHDNRLDAGDDSRGLTDGSGVVWETAREEVLAARVLDTQETVPTLEDALEVLTPEVGVNVELKNPGTSDVRPGESLDRDEVDRRRDRWDPFVERVIGILEGVASERLVSSFHEPAVAAVRDLAPDFQVGTLVGGSTEDSLAVAKRYDCEAIHPHVNVIQGTSFPGEPPNGSDRSDDGIDIVAAAQDLGCAINVWTVRTWYEAERLAAAGVDGVIADYPNLLRRR
jgi:glycerophosphoryl diester phosphodiesterase